VKQVEIVILQPGPIQRGLENGFHLAGFLHIPEGQLGGALEAVTGIAVHHGLLQGHLAFAADVHIGGVEVGKTFRHKGVHHALCLLDVDFVAQHGQAHQAKAQVLNAFAQIFFCHWNVLPL
jgi:hypothetical protein